MLESNMITLMVNIYNMYIGTLALLGLWNRDTSEVNTRIELLNDK